MSDSRPFVRCQACGLRELASVADRKWRSTRCPACRGDNPPAAAAAATLHPVITNWRDSSLAHMAYETAGTVELRVVCQDGTRVATFASVAAAVLAIGNDRIPWRDLVVRDRSTAGDDLGCLGVAHFEL